MPQRHHAVGAIGPHPGQEQRHRRDAPQPGRRVEQDIDRRALVVNGGASADDGAQLDPPGLHDHVEVPWRDVGDTPAQQFGPGLDHAHRTDRVQPPGKRLRELRGHVLDDQDGRRVGWQPAQEGLDGLGASGGRPDQDQAVRLCQHRRLGERQRGMARAQRRQEPHGPARLQLADSTLEPVGDLAHRIGSTGFRNHVNGAGGQRLDTGVRTRRRHRADDDHRHGVMFHQPLEEREPVHPRHLDVQRQHVRLVAQDQVTGDKRIGRDTDDFDVRLTTEHVGQHLAHDGRVVDDKDAHLPLGPCHVRIPPRPGPPRTKWRPRVADR